MTNIETLQTQVDQVAKDLADLKKLTDETLKQTKAEAAADKVKTAKEEINKKIEALKGLTDATSKADLAKLEAMLVTLESSETELTTLKAEITPSIDVSENSETDDTTADMETIKTNIAEIKTLATALQSEIDAYKIAKSTMTADEIIKKDKDIADKKLAIETKRKATQTLIDKINEAWKLLKIDDMPEGAQKTALKQLQTKLADYETQLKAIETPGRTVREKVKDGANKWWERAKEHPKTAIAATAWIGLLIRWISRLFRKKKKSETEGDKTEKEGFRNHGIGQLLKYAGIWIAWFFGLKWLRNQLKPEIVKPPEEQKSDFDKLSEAEKKKYNDFADNVNTMNSILYKTDKDKWWENNVNLGIWYDEKEEKEYRWVVPFSMDKSYTNVEAMISETWINKAIIGKTIQEYITYLSDRPKEKLSSLLLPFLMRIESFSVLWYKPGEDLAECIKKWLETDPDANKKLDFFFEQHMTVLTYLKETEIKLQEKIALKKLKTELHDSKKRDDLTKDEQDEVLADALADSDRMETNVNPTLKTKFEEKQISELSGSLSEFDLDEEKVSPDLEKDITSIDKDRDDIMDYDEDTKVDVLDKALTDVADGKIDASTRNNLVECVEKLSADAIDLNGEWFMQKYFEPIAIMFNMDSVAKEKFIENSKWKDFLVEFSKTMSEYKTKFESGTVTAEDIKNFRTLTNKYFAFKKETIIAIHTMTGINSDDSNLLERAWITYLSIITSFRDALHEKMWFMERGAKLSYGCIIIWGTLYLTSFLTWSKISRVAGKNMVKLWTFVPRKWIGLAMKMTKCSIMDKVPLPWWYRKKVILDSTEPSQMLKNAVMTGKIDEASAVKIAKNPKLAWWWTINSMEDVLVKYCWITDKTEAKMIKTYLKNANTRKIIIEQSTRSAFGSKVDRMKYKIRERQIGFDYEFKNIAKLKVIDALGSDAGGNIVKSALKGVSIDNFDLLHDIAKKPTAVTSLTKRFDQKIITPDKFGEFLGKNLGQFTDVADFESFLKQVPLSEATDAKTLKMIMQNRKDVWPRLTKGEKLKDIIPTLSKKFVKTTPTVKPIEPIVENLSESQKALKTKIEDKISILKKKYSATWATKVEKAVIDESVGSLEDVVKNLKSIPEDEAVAMKKLFSLGVDIKYTSKILEVKDVKSLLTKIDAAKDVSELELALKWGKLDDLAKTLKTANKMDDLFKEFKPLVKELKLVKLLEEGKDIAKIVKIISKVDKFL